MSDAEEEEANKLAGNHDKATTVATALEPIMKDLQEKLKAKKAAADSKKGRPTKKAKASASGPVPRAPTGDDPTLQEAQLILPPGAKIYKDAANNRWRGYYDDFSISRPWVCRPSKKCAKEVCKALWDWHTTRTGEPCHIECLM